MSHFGGDFPCSKQGSSSPVANTEQSNSSNRFVPRPPGKHEETHHQEFTRQTISRLISEHGASFTREMLPTPP